VCPYVVVLRICKRQDTVPLLDICCMHHQHCFGSSQ
jgi:hypothetical protein